MMTEEFVCKYYEKYGKKQSYLNFKIFHLTCNKPKTADWKLLCLLVPAVN